MKRALRLGDRLGRFFFDTPEGIALCLIGASVLLSFQAEVWK